MHAITIGSGLGRDLSLLKDFGFILENLADKITVGDADFFWFLSQDVGTYKNLIKKFKRIVLTPNILEFSRLFKTITNKNLDTAKIDEFLKSLTGKEEIVEADIFKNLEEIKQFYDFFENKNLCLIIKYRYDIIITDSKCFVVKTAGSLKRVGGQGDILCGLTGYFCEMADSKSQDISSALIFASFVTRRASFEAFKKQKLGLITTDILEYIPQVVNHFLDDFYERDLSDSFHSLE